MAEDDELDQPPSADSLYLVRGAGEEPLRPVLQGDVFRDTVIPGVDGDDANLAMVVSHACSIRAGAHLRPHLLMARVRPSPDIQLNGWATGFFKQLPFPRLLNDDTHFSAFFDEVGRVPSAAIVPAARIACLDASGILLLQQRVAFYHTRVKVGLGRLLEVSQPVFEEVELLEEWLRRFVPGPQYMPGNVAREEEAFDAVLREERDGKTLRDWLLDPTKRAMVRRAVYEAMGSRT